MPLCTTPLDPGLTRSSLNRCWQLHGISRVPNLKGDKPVKKNFKSQPIDFFRLDTGEVRAGEGKLYLFVAIDRMPEFAVAWLCDEATRRTACQFLEQVLIVVPDKLHTILADNGIQFAEQTRNRGTILSHLSHFDVTCETNGIEHRLNQPNDPGTSGQVERMNRTIRGATTKRSHYDDHDELEADLDSFLDAYNYAR